jgi:hypothetical protein
MRLLRGVTDDVEILRDRAAAGAEALLADRAMLDSVKYVFITAIEGAIRASQHVAASESWEAPATNADAFRVLAAHGVIDTALAETPGGGRRVPEPADPPVRRHRRPADRAQPGVARRPRRVRRRGGALGRRGDQLVPRQATSAAFHAGQMTPLAASSPSDSLVESVGLRPCQRRPWLAVQRANVA